MDSPSKSIVKAVPDSNSLFFCLESNDAKHGPEYLLLVND
jgi:hypothetical protein